MCSVTLENNGSPKKRMLSRGMSEDESLRSIIKEVRWQKKSRRMALIMCNVLAKIQMVYYTVYKLLVLSNKWFITQQKLAKENCWLHLLHFPVISWLCILCCCDWTWAKLASSGFTRRARLQPGGWLEATAGEAPWGGGPTSRY